jgi:hypothetical protein
MSTDEWGRRFAAELLDSTAELDAAEGLQRMHAVRRRNSVATTLAVALVLLLAGLVALPALRANPAPPAGEQTEQVAGFGLSVDLPPGWVSEGEGDDEGFRIAPDAGSSDARFYIQDYLVESVWNPTETRLEDLAAGGFAAWLRENPSFIVESEWPVTVGGQEVVTQQFRPDLSVAADAIPMLAGAVRDRLDNGIRLFDPADIGLATALTIGGQTVVIEAVMPSDGGPVAGLSGDEMVAAYAAVLASARIDPTWEWWYSGLVTDSAPNGMTFPTVGDWTAPKGLGTGSAPEWYLEDRGSAGPEGRDSRLSIILMQVLGVPNARGACCVLPSDGMGAWLTRDSGLTVLAETPVDIEQPTAVYELVAPAKDPVETGAPFAMLWGVGVRPETTPTELLDPAGGDYQFSVDWGARLLVAPFNKDGQTYLLFTRLPYDPVEQTPIRPVEQLRTDFLAIAEGISW